MVDEWFEVAEGGRLNPGPDEELNWAAEFDELLLIEEDIDDPRLLGDGLFAPNPPLPGPDGPLFST